MPVLASKTKSILDLKHLKLRLVTCLEVFYLEDRSDWIHWTTKAKGNEASMLGKNSLNIRTVQLPAKAMSLPFAKHIAKRETVNPFPGIIFLEQAIGRKVTARIGAKNSKFTLNISIFLRLGGAMGFRRRYGMQQARIQLIFLHFISTSLLVQLHVGRACSERRYRMGRNKDLDAV